MQYILFSVVKHNTDIKGYWTKGNKTYIDNIELIKCNTKNDLKDKIKALFSSGELAVFYKNNQQGIIEDQKGNRNNLNRRIEYKYKKGYANIQQIKDIIDQYNGCTVYSKKGYIIIEVFTN